MAPLSDALIGQLRKMQLLHRVDEIVPMFEGAIDVGATVHLHADAFKDFTEYMEKYIREYSIMFEGLETLWVPVDLIKHIFREDKNFRFRLSRFMKSLTERDHRVEDEDLLMELQMGNIGTAFMSWDMVLVFLIQEGVTKSGKQVKKEKSKQVELIQEAQAEEENVTAQWEASMALMLLQGNEPEEVPDRLLEGEEVFDEIPELAILSLIPIIIDGKEFLFLDDIAKTLGLREDEILSVIATHVGIQDNSSHEGNMQITFEDENLTRALEYDVSNTSLESVVAKALVQIKREAEFYESVPDSAFEPHTPLFTGNVNDQGSIDLTKEQLVQIDDATETAFEVDKFAMRTGGTRPKSEGRDASFWHYIPALRADIVRVFHLDYSEIAYAELLKCKALSAVLSEDSLASNTNKCILVSREAARFCFASKHPGSLLGHCALSQAQGINEPSSIVQSLGEKPASKTISPDLFQELIKKL